MKTIDIIQGHRGNKKGYIIEKNKKGGLSIGNYVRSTLEGLYILKFNDDTLFYSYLKGIGGNIDIRFKIFCVPQDKNLSIIDTYEYNLK